jgi:mannose-6-phosphate isomerase-like protein (cupin superfamily)
MRCEIFLIRVCGEEHVAVKTNHTRGEAMDIGKSSGEIVELGHGGEIADHGGIVVEKLLEDVPVSRVTVGFAMYAPGSKTGDQPVTHGGKEFLMVLEGAMVAEVQGETFALSEGDTIFFASTKPHRGWNPHESPAKALFVNFQV